MRQILPVLLSLFSLACSSASSHDPNAPPNGCKRTMCDLVRSSCTNPPPPPDYCMECLNTCTGPYSTSDCSECNDMCTTPPSPTPDYCGRDLDSCRKTTTNAICVDGIEDTPAGAPPCNDVASRASCASSDDEDAQNAIYKANPACKACDDGWVDGCVKAVCTTEGQTVAACMQKNNCTDALLCFECKDVVHTYETCFWNALSDPSDVGGCYSGSHACWTLPVCHADGSASK